MDQISSQSKHVVKSSHLQNTLKLVITNIFLRGDYSSGRWQWTKTKNSIALARRRHQFRSA